MPKDGLPDAKLDIHVAKKKKLERPLSDQEKALKTQFEIINRELDDLKSFNGQDIINNHCDMLEIDVIVAVESAHKRINEIGDEWINNINEYRTKSLNSWSLEASKVSNPTKSRL